MRSDGPADNISQSLVVVWRRGESVVGGDRKSRVIPEVLTRAIELLLGEFLQSSLQKNRLGTAIMTTL
jgi:hypothetical protein